MCYADAASAMRSASLLPCHNDCRELSLTATTSPPLRWHLPSDNDDGEDSNVEASSAVDRQLNAPSDGLRCHGDKIGGLVLLQDGARALADEEHISPWMVRVLAPNVPLFVARQPV